MRRFSRRRAAGLGLAVFLILLIPLAHAFLPILFSAGRVGAFVGAAASSSMRAAGYGARDPRIVSTVAGLGRGMAQ
jgi:hypothetical protein